MAESSQNNIFVTVGETKITPFVHVGEPHYFCRKCDNDGDCTEITLLSMYEVCHEDHFGYKGGLIRAYHVKNVKYDMANMDHMIIQPPPITKLLHVYCEKCFTLLGWLKTDTIGGVRDVGDYFRDHLLMRERLV